MRKIRIGGRETGTAETGRLSAATRSRYGVKKKTTALSTSHSKRSSFSTVDRVRAEATSTRSDPTMRSRKTTIADAGDDLHTPGPLEPQLRALLQAVVSQAKGLDLDRIVHSSGGVEVVVSKMFASVPGANYYDEKIGPFYDTTGLRIWKGITRQSIDGQAERGDLLCVRTRDGHRLYPAFQFDGPEGAPLPQLRRVLAALDPRGIDAWGDALWLNSAVPEFDGATPAQALRQGRIAEVVAQASRAGSLWAP